MHLCPVRKKEGERTREKRNNAKERGDNWVEGKVKGNEKHAKRKIKGNTVRGEQNRAVKKGKEGRRRKRTRELR